jgi:hypothetical protein
MGVAALSSPEPEGRVRMTVSAAMTRSGASSGSFFWGLLISSDDEDVGKGMTTYDKLLVDLDSFLA